MNASNKNEKSIKLLGIASWECVLFKDELEEFQNNSVNYNEEKVNL